MSYAELELGLYRRDGSGYAIDMRFVRPDAETDQRLPSGKRAVLELDLAELLALGADNDAYGKALSAALFADPAVATLFGQARAVAAQDDDVPLRIRLLIGPEVPELHAVRWELLRDPANDQVLLLTDENLLFSRYLNSFDWRQVRRRPKGELRALVVIANPTGLEQQRPNNKPLAPVDVAGERSRAEASLAGVSAISLLDSGGKASLSGMSRALRDGYDVLYLACHGALIRGEPKLWLEKEDGSVDVIAGADLVDQIRKLQEQPRLIVLASCESAKADGEQTIADNGSLAALGPQLAAAGVPAVIAMGGSITMQSVALFMPEFFKELLRDGQIDRAMATARNLLVQKQRLDCWMPLLFMRLRSGQIWYVPGFGESRQDLEKWPRLLRSIRRGTCTPIIGSFLSEAMLGSSRDMAERWAEKYNFPLAPEQRDDLPQVAQFLATFQDRPYVREELEEYLVAEILDRFGSRLSEQEQKGSIDELFAALGRIRRENPADPYRVLAELPFKIYVTTNATNMLAEALRAANKDPVVEIFRWSPDLEELGSIFEDDPDYEPSPERPLVYHLFGNFHEPGSLVLTEDDYFDFLIGSSRNRELMPPVVRDALADCALFVVGFRLDDWAFRVVHRMLEHIEGGSRRKKDSYAHVAAQFLPEEGRVLEPEGARKHLERYFGQTNISIYWGSVEDLMKELLVKWQESANERSVGRR